MALHKLRIETAGPEWLYVPDVEYHKYGEISRKLQMIIPYGATKRYPLILFLPGSAWYRQEMYNSVPAWAKLAERGYVFAALQYRESTLAKFPAQIEDVFNAISFLKERADVFHIDMNRVYLMGQSSGAYDVLMAGMTETQQIKGIISLSAPSYPKVETEVWEKGKQEYDPQKYRPTLDMLGLRRFEDDMELYHRARIANYIAPEREISPILLFHGDGDEIVPVEQSRKLYDALTAAGKTVTYYEIKGQGHGGPWQWDRKILDAIDSFAKENA